MAEHDRHNPSIHTTIFQTNRLLLEPIKRLVKYVPASITGDHLTLMSLIWSALAILAGFLAKRRREWLLLIPVLVMCHIVTDTLDGQVGRYRGIPGTKWGYFMDHFMDFTVGSSIFVAFLLYLHPRYHLLFFGIYLAAISTMIVSFLSIDKKGLDITGCIGKYCLSCTEGQILLAVLAVYLYISKRNPNKTGLLVFLTVMLVFAIGNVYTKQKYIKNKGD